MELAGKNVVVVGMAKSGTAAVKLLVAHGARVRPVDSSPHAPVEGLAVLPQEEASFDGADLVVISPGVPADLPLLAKVRARGVPVIGELELAAPYLKGPVIGITGSNGKTTTTALTGHMLREAGVASQVGGNIGTPPAAMTETSRDGQWNVLELSSFQLETIKTFRAQIAACLNLTQNHLDRHHTFNEYVNAKRRLFETQTSGDVAILNADDPVTVAFAHVAKALPRWFSGTKQVDGAWLAGETIFLDGKPLINTRDLKLRGRHNYENVMAAALIASIAGAKPDDIARAAAGFQPVEHRLEPVRVVKGVAYYNDSKATSVDATLKAMDAFDGGLWVILGGYDKGSDYSPLREPLHAKAHAALLIGAAAPKIAEHLGDKAVQILHCGTLASAVDRAYQLAEPGDTVLLAPACSSFDQFENYEHRGRVFKELVRALAGGEK